MHSILMWGISSFFFRQFCSTFLKSSPALNGLHLLFGCCFHCSKINYSYKILNIHHVILYSKSAQNNVGCYLVEFSLRQDHHSFFFFYYCCFSSALAQPPFLIGPSKNQSTDFGFSFGASIIMLSSPWAGRPTDLRNIFYKAPYILLTVAIERNVRIPDILSFRRFSVLSHPCSTVFVTSFLEKQTMRT